MGKQASRQKCQPKLYTEADLRRMTKDALMLIERHHMKVSIGSFALALHRKLKLDSNQIADVLTAASEYSMNALCFEDVRKELLEEAGLDIEDFTEGI